MTYDPETHTYYDASGAVLPSVTQILKHAGYISDFYAPGAAERGERVHRATEELDRYGEILMEVDEEIAPYVDCYKAWREEHPDHVPLAWEEIVEGGTLWPPYAGRVDMFMRIPGLDGRVVVDKKTGQPAKWHRIQLAAYALASAQPNAAALYLSPDKPARLRVVKAAEMDEAIKLWGDALEGYYATHG